MCSLREEHGRTHVGEKFKIKAAPKHDQEAAHAIMK
jgi:hypothetical protein